MIPAISVVIPCFNLGAYLDEAVQSVLRQTRQDFEIVIVDDGSDDPVTRHLLASYRRPRTRVIATGNRGLASARNTGIEQASGRFVSFLDADDVYEPRFLERTIGPLEADESLAFASCWLTAFGEKEFVWEPQTCEFPWLLAEDTVCTAAPTRREALVAVGGLDEDERIGGYEDWELAISLVKNGFTGVIVPERLFRYRIRPESMSTWCTRPQNHARLFAYLLDKHAEVYQEHASGVLDAIGRRTDELEGHLQIEPPSRPAVDVSNWREAMLELERHRRAIEQTVVDADEPRPAAQAPVDLGSLRRLEPVSRVWGLDRGQPVDRYYIEQFLQAHSGCIAGDVLEIKDPVYTTRFGTQVRSVTVLDIAQQNPEATLIADLCRPDSLPEARYDCALVVQTFHVIYEIAAAARNVHRALAPGGVLLATLPCVSRVDYESGLDADFWRFTAASARRLFEEVFSEGEVEVEAFGNVLTGTAFLQGMASSELEPAELERCDPYFPVLIAVRAKKRGSAETARPRAVEGRVERATCAEVSGWAWDREAPEQRLQLELREGDRVLGRAWAHDARADVGEGPEGDRRLGFRFTFEPRRHAGSQAHIEVRALTGEPLPGSLRVAECVCGGVAGASSLSGSHIDSPRAGADLPFPWLDVLGWALGEDAPVEAVELSHQGEVFRRVPVKVARPDLAEAFPDVAWSGTAGFAARINLVATGGRLELEVHAVLAGDRRVSIGRVEVDVAQAPPAPVIVAISGVAARSEALGRLLDQQSPVTRAVLLDVPGRFDHPGFTAGSGGWNELFDDPEGLVWCCTGGEAVSSDFLTRATAALADRREASFAVATAAGEQPGLRSLTAVLSGRALGAAILFRASAARAVAGIDEGAQDLVAAQWDLAIRLTDAGHEWLELPGAGSARAATLAERCDEHAMRWLYRKHAAAFERDLEAVLLDREAQIGELLKDNHLKERVLEAEHLPRLTARRRERDRLGAKLRRSRAASSVDRTVSPTAWGDFRRLEPLSPSWGSERGLCVDRYYIERFLEEHAEDIRGSVLEVQDSVYATRYGGDRVARCDILDIDATNPHATVIADLRDARGIPSASYDCLVLTQVLPYIDDPAAAIFECRRILRPGGVLLATVPCAGRVAGVTTEHWRWSYGGFRSLVSKAFDPSQVDVRSHGSRNTVLAFLVAIAAEEVDREVLDRDDPEAPLVLSARAVVPGGEDGE